LARRRRRAAAHRPQQVPRGRAAHLLERAQVQGRGPQGLPGRSSAGARVPPAARPGVHEPARERRAGHREAGPGLPEHAGRGRVRGRARAGHGAGHPARASEQALRAVLHHQGGRHGHRARPPRGVQDRQRPSGQDRDQLGRGTGHGVYGPDPARRTASRGRDGASGREEAVMIAAQKSEASVLNLYHWHTVLVVDDDREVLAALRRVLDREPYDVVTTDRPGLALDWMSRKNISLVISDQLMPEMDGDRFLEEVWKHSPTTGRLLLTGHPERLNAIPASRRNLLKVMLKPWEDGDLRKTIRTLLREREGSQG